MLILLLADTGVRVSEALHLRWSDLNFADLLMTVHGKGPKVRTIPFSPAMRKYLIRFEQHSTKSGLKSDTIFCTRTGNALGRRTVNRDVHRLCKLLDIREPARIVHALRHSYALGALRAGASTMHVMRCLVIRAFERYADAGILPTAHRRFERLPCSHRQSRGVTCTRRRYLNSP